MIISYYRSVGLFRVKYKIFSLFVFFCFVITVVSKSQDSTKAQTTIQIVSSYKPVLKPATKLGFSASPLPPVPFSNKFIYQVPDQQYKVLMRPVDLIPAIFMPDSIALYNRHFVKIGYGNYDRIFADAGTSWGAGKPLQFQLFAGHHALRGNKLFQQNSRSYAQAAVQYFFNKHIFRASACAHHNNFYYFGNDSIKINDNKDSLRFTYNLWSVDLVLKNQTPNSYGVTYEPAIKFHFLDATKSNEINTLISIPLQVKINSQASFAITAKADLSQYRITGDTSYQNNLYSVYPSVQFPLKDFLFNVGFQAAWDNDNLNLLPQLGFEAFIKNNKVVAIAGAQSNIQKNTFQSLLQSNPWIEVQRLQKNTRVDEFFAGLRGTLPFSFTYRVTGGFVQYSQLPLFTNISKTSLFAVEHESRLQSFHVKASAEWIPSENISTDIGLDLYQILRQKDEKKAWHFIPVEVHLGAKWKPTKNLMIQSKIFAWDGPFVKVDDKGNSKKLPAVADANVEFDFRISKLFLVWLQMNNIFNQQYERWNQYPVLGFQLIGGIRLNFDQKKK
jgi:hypothetical protein